MALISKERPPYHFMETAIRITTAAEIRTREGPQLADLLSVTEDVGGTARHATNDLSIWLGNQSDPASVVTVCDRLIAALTEIRQRNAGLAAPALPDGVEFVGTVGQFLDSIEAPDDATYAGSGCCGAAPGTPHWVHHPNWARGVPENELRALAGDR